jgi:hypothetical protein
MMDDIFERQRRISAVAHQVWLDEGCPADRGVEHWNRATEIIAAQDAGELPRPQRGGAKKPKAA